jgi:hypothetical protein
MTSYSATLNLPKTDFPMRAGLPKREPDFLDFWYTNEIYEKKQKLHAGHKKFVLHDGPPYANGKIHMGHGPEQGPEGHHHQIQVRPGLRYPLRARLGYARHAHRTRLPEGYRRGPSQA